jgi:lipopolysaccharide/colanic/teichoic acid biosynthesis glycosyltransferase
MGNFVDHSASPVFFTNFITKKKAAGLKAAASTKTVDSLSRSQKISLKAKRVVDVTLASCGIATLSPLLLLVAVGIRLDSKGPVLFSQERWGKDNTPIRVYKFRSMRTDLCDAAGTRQCAENDPRVTRLGRFLRKSNIDELPQLFNVLKGDMSLIGPRCHPIGMLAADVPYEELVPNYHERHKVRPGITGLAQVRGLRGPTVRPSKARARVAMDIYYIENYSLWLDVKILYQTFKKEFLNGTGF